MEITITPPKGLVDIDLGELWRYRELLYIFVWRDIKVRYKQTVLGALWAIFQPLAMMAVFTIFFGRLVHVPSDNIPYPIFVFAGLLLWNYFSLAVTNASNSFIDNESIVKKVYFPRVLLPISTAVTPLIDFVISFIILFVLMAIYHFSPHWIGLVWVIGALLIAFIAVAGGGLLLAAVNAKYRDVRYILPFFVQTLMYLTPVIYPVSLIPQRFQWILYLNPMTGAISLIRANLLRAGTVDWLNIGISSVAALVLFIGGLTYFRKTERFFADVL